MAEKDEEKKPDFDPFDESEFYKKVHDDIKERARLYYIEKKGLNAEDAEKVAIVTVKRYIRHKEIAELKERVSEDESSLVRANLRMKKGDSRTVSLSGVTAVRERIERNKDRIERLKEEINKLDKAVEDIFKKKGLLEKDYSEVQDVWKKEVFEIDKKLERRLLSKSMYIDKKKKIDAFFEDVFNTKKQTREEGAFDTTRFKCPECREGHLFEHYDKDTGRLTFRCANKDCKRHEDGFPPGEVYSGHAIAGNVPLLKWKSREAAGVRSTFDRKLDELDEAIKKGWVKPEDYGDEVKRIRKEVYGYGDRKERRKQRRAYKEAYRKEMDDFGEKEKNLREASKRWRTDKEGEYKKRVGEIKSAFYNDPEGFEREEQRIYDEVYGNENPYEKQLNELMAAKKGKIEELEKGRPRRKTFIEKFGGPMSRFSRTGEDFVKKVIFIVAIIGIGAVVAVSLGQMLFFLGFLSLGLYFMTPPPEKIEAEGEVLGWSHINPFVRRPARRHVGWAWIRSVTKVSAILFFAFGFRNMGDIFNIFFIVTCLIGYFSLKLTYDPKQPGEFIESLLRFGILGCYFIPLYVFAGIFNSYVLAAIAFAFFAIPPMPETSRGQDLSEVLSRGLSGQTAYYEMFDKLLFTGLMLFALLGSGSLGNLPVVGNLGWQLTGTLKYTFIYFWTISAIGGFFSPARERPMTGMLFLGGATIIYGIGPGSQDIGSALLGEWWPTVNSAVSTISEPISKMFSQLGKTFGDAFLLLTNPVGYATQLMNGSYSSNPVGETGPVGVELSDFDVSPIFIEQPFMITATMTNVGAHDAEDVKISLSAGAKSPEKQWTSLGIPAVGIQDKKLSTIPMKLSHIGIEDCKKTEGSVSSWTDECGTHVYSSGSGSSKLTQKNIWQTVFRSVGISCPISNIFELRKKYMPINVTLNYKYQSDSKVEVEFISRQEWERLAKEDKLNQKLRFIKSEYSSAPVKFPIGTPGLKNPIPEDQDFHIALTLSSDQQGGRIGEIETLELYFPPDFELASDGCRPTPDPKDPIEPDPANGKNYYTIKWKGQKGGGDMIFYCHFKPLKPDAKSESKLGGSPTKTYIATAYAKYNYSVTKQKDMKVEFGSWCCVGEDGSCAKEYKCCSEDPDPAAGKGICIPESQKCATTKGVAWTSDEWVKYASGGHQDIKKAFEASQASAAQTPSSSTGCSEPSAELKKQYIDAAASATGVETALIKAVIMWESTFQHCLANGGAIQTSPKGALGLMQLLPDTAAGLNVNPYKPDENVMGGANHIKFLLGYYKGDLKKALAGYNWDQKNLDGLLSSNPSGWESDSKLPQETKAFIQDVMGYLNCYRQKTDCYSRMTMVTCTCALR